jgi:protein O-mannose beta-1,4-N-acetylglucosaminyltransferase
MHGSLLTLSMFCRRGTVLLEMFPYAVPSEDYLPYKTMAELPGMDIVYRAWENKDENASKSYPNRKPMLGGINHLPVSERTAIMQSNTVPKHLCCEDPNWLYRIYQDTRVNLDEVVMLISEALSESRTRILTRIADGSSNYYSTQLLPPLVDGIGCLQGVGRNPGSLWIEWEAPWTGAVVDKYSIQIENTVSRVCCLT